MFDDFKQDKTDKELDILSSSPLPLNKKLALSLAACSILFLFAWNTYDSASSTAQSENSSSAIAQLTKRVEILEQTLDVHTTMASQKPTDKDFKKQILTFASDTSKELSDTDTKAPSTFSSQTQSDTISFSEPFQSMPREIPIELSSLFEKEIAISTNNPSETTELVDTKETLQKKVSQNIVKPTPVQKNQIDKTSEGNRTYQNTKRTYTVQKGDTLSKISLKFYGTSNKWKKIVDANKEKLGNSQILKSGMLLVIPEE